MKIIKTRRKLGAMSFGFVVFYLAISDGVVEGDITLALEELLLYACVPLSYIFFKSYVSTQQGRNIPSAIENEIIITTGPAEYGVNRAMIPGCQLYLTQKQLCYIKKSPLTKHAPLSFPLRDIVAVGRTSAPGFWSDHLAITMRSGETHLFGISEVSPWVEELQKLLVASSQLKKAS